MHQGPPQAAPYMTGMQAMNLGGINMNQSQSVQQLDKQLKMFVNMLKTDRKEIAGIQVEMPRNPLQQL